MRKLLVPAVAAAILATSAVAFAATKNTTGTVKAFDSKSHDAALNGNEYMLPQASRTRHQDRREGHGRLGHEGRQQDRREGDDRRNDHSTAG